MTNDQEALQDFCQLTASIIIDMQDYCKTDEQRQCLEAAIWVIDEIAPHEMQAKPLLSQLRQYW